MPVPTCSTTCDTNLAVVKFDDCAPKVAFSEIRRIFIAKTTAAPFVNWLLAAEWITRLSSTSVTGDNYIRALTVIADKPAATPVSKDISNGRKITIGKDHTINFTIDDVSDENYEFMRSLECGNKYRFWFETEGGYMYGGNEGFTANVDANDVLNRGRDEIETIAGAMTWRSKFSAERGLSPIYTGSSSSTPVIFDQDLVFDTSADQAFNSLSATSAIGTNANLEFEFTGIDPTSIPPNDMTIVVGSTTEMVVSYPGDYAGQAFRFTDSTGTTHTGVFTNGTVTF